MIDLKLLRKDPDAVKRSLARRRADVDLGPVIAKDAARREIQQQADALRAKLKSRSDEMGKLVKAGENPQELRAQLKLLSDEVKALEQRQAGAEAAMETAALVIPNILCDDVPEGAGEQDNKEILKWGTLPQYDFKPQPHWDIGEKLGILDFQRGSKVAQARFTALIGAGARLERALINFMMDTHAAAGYTEVWPPFLVNSRSMTGTGQLPKFKDDLFKCESFDLWLAPTAEVPVTNLHADEIFSESDLPRRYAAYTPCFRSEAGSYGKDVRGLIRQHQFDKVELVKFCAPEQAEGELESLRASAESILQKLNLHYRIVVLCSADTGFASAKTYDLEVWLPGQSAYREISSCSTFTDFQARRAKIRYRPAKGSPQFVHTLNGSGLAVGRTLVAILENYQRKDGSVVVPEVLRPYMNGLDVIVS